MEKKKVTLTKMQKDILVKKNFRHRVVLNLYLLLYGETTETIQKFFKEIPGAADALEYSTQNYKTNTEKIFTVTAKELKQIIEDLVLKNNFFENYFDSLEELIKTNGNLLQYIPEEKRTEEMIRDAITNFPRAIHFVTNPTEEQYLLALSNRDVYLGDDVLCKLSDETILTGISTSGSELINQIPESRWTKSLLYKCLEQMVHQNKDFGLSYSQKIPIELKDKIYYRSLCMIHGFYYSKVSKDERSDMFSERLVNYTLDHAKAYNSALWLMEYIPENLKTHDICLKACIKHFGASEYIPDKYKNDEFYQQLYDAGQYHILGSIDLTTISKSLFTKFCEMDKGFSILDKKIPKSLWSKDAAIAICHAWNNALQILPKDYMTYKICCEFIKHHGANIDEVPDKLIDEEMCILAMRSNSFAALRNIPDRCKTESFWKRVVHEGIYYKPTDVPLEFQTHEAVVKKIKERQDGAFIKSLPPEYMKECIDNTTLAVAIPEEKQNQEMCDYVMQVTATKADWIRYRSLTHILPQYRRNEDIEWAMENVKEAISLDHVTKENIQTSLMHFPDNYLEVPDWYQKVLLDLENEKPEVKAETIPEKKVAPKVEAAEVDGEFEQMSIWDILTA